jgi:hypothetical protein
MDQKHFIREIVQFVRGYGEKVPVVTKWKKPLVGFASADDPLFSKLKEVVRPSHAMPQDSYIRPVSGRFSFPLKTHCRKKTTRQVSILLAAGQWRMLKQTA